MALKRVIVTATIGIVLTLCLGVLYPLVVTGISQLTFRGNANGQKVYAGGSASPGTHASIVQMKWQDCDDHVRAGLEDRREQPRPLVVEDLVPALARDDLGDQHRDRGVLVLYRLDVLQDGPDQRALRIDQYLDRYAAAPVVPIVSDLVSVLLVARHCDG